MNPLTNNSALPSVCTSPQKSSIEYRIKRLYKNSYCCCCLSTKKHITNNKYQEIDVQSAKQHQISDRCLKISFLWLGIGFLLPFNAVITAVDYFQLLYGQSIVFYLGWLLLTPQLIVLIFTLKCGLFGTIFQQILASFVSFVFLTVIIPLVNIRIVLFICSVFLGIMTAVLQASVFSLLGFLGPDLMSITQTGVGISGVLIGITRLITKFILNSDIVYATYMYFLLAVVGILINIIVFVFIIHPSPKVQKAIFQLRSNKKNHKNYMQEKKKKINNIAKQNQCKQNEKNSILNKTNNMNEYLMSHSLVSPNYKRIMHHRKDAYDNNNCKISKSKSISYSYSYSPHLDADMNDKRRLMMNSDSNKYGSTYIGIEDNAEYDNCLLYKPLTICQLFLCSWQCNTAVFLNYTVSLALFPGVISIMTWNLASDSWFAIGQILLFNFFDTVMDYFCVHNLYILYFFVCYIL